MKRRLAGAIDRLYRAPKGPLFGALQGRALHVYAAGRVWLDWHRRSQIVIVHTAGKVGSRAAQHAIASALGRDAAVFHTHRLGTVGSAAALRGRRGMAPRLGWFMSESVAKQLASGPRRSVTFVTIVRDPVARNVSAYFQANDRWRDRMETSGGGSTPESFAESFPHDQMIRWFDEEIIGFLGAPILDVAFDRTAGYLVVPGRLGRVVVLRAEDLSSRLPGAIEAVFGVAPKEVGEVNLSANKSYADDLERFRAEVRLPAERLRSVYSAPLLTHFYEPSEIDAFRDRWGVDDR